MEQNNNMALASMIVGIISIVMSCCCFLGMILGSTAVILAGLSRTEEHMTGYAKAGLAAGIAGMVLGIGSIIVWMIVLGRM